MSQRLWLEVSSESLLNIDIKFGRLHREKDMCIEHVIGMCLDVDSIKSPAENRNKPSSLVH